MGVITKALDTEHEAIVIEKIKFDQEMFRSKSVEEGIRKIIGKLKKANKPSDPMIIYSYRFDSEKYSVEQSKKWLKDKEVDYIKFEPAKEENKMEVEERKTEVIKDEKALQHKQFSISDFKVGETEDGKVFIEGYANTKGKPDRYGDIPTVFEPIRNYVYELKEFKKNPVLMLDHSNSTSNIAGSFNPKMGGYVYEDNIGLKFKAVFSDSDYPLVRHARTIYKEGHGRALSIGGRWFFEDKDNPKNLTYADILEISLVGIGADPDALTKKNVNTEGKSDEVESPSKPDGFENQADLTEDLKAGRVLSKANEGKIRQIADLASAVLKSLEKEEDKSCLKKQQLKKRFILTMKNSSL